jgi:hypothetical protein
MIKITSRSLQLQQISLGLSRGLAADNSEFPDSVARLLRRLARRLGTFDDCSEFDSDLSGSLHC